MLQRPGQLFLTLPTPRSAGKAFMSQARQVINLMLHPVERAITVIYGTRLTGWPVDVAVDW